MIMEQLRFSSGDLAICIWHEQTHAYNNGIIVKILHRYPVEDLPLSVLDHSPPGDVFWWVKTCGAPLRYRRKKNLVKQIEGCVHDSALQRLCKAPQLAREERAHDGA